MDEIDKRYKTFLSKWGNAFGQIPSILSILRSYPELSSRINFAKSLNLDHLHKIQFEYISLISRFDHPIEASFFKEYHVPIEEDSYDYFIDMSTKGFSIFLISYFQFEPQHWYRSIIFKDVIELINSIDKSSFNIEKHFEEFRRKKRKLVNKKVEQRELLEESIKTLVLPIKENDLFLKSNENKYLFN